MRRWRTGSFAPGRQGRADGGLSGQDESAGHRERAGRSARAADDAAQGDARLRPRPPVLAGGRQVAALRVRWEREKRKQKEEPPKKPKRRTTKAAAEPAPPVPEAAGRPAKR